MDSTGLRLIVSADARAREQGRRLAVVRGPEAVQRIFRVTRLEDRLDMVDDPAALAS
jgi:anti-sigma B factor antagonist